MTKNKPAILLLLILTISYISFLDSHGESSNPFINTPDASAYPDADSLIIHEKIDITLNEDGTQSKHCYQVVKLFSDLSIDELCDPKLKFDDSKQTLNIIKARTYMKDDTIVDSTPKCFNPITPPELSKAPDYTSNKQMVVTFLGVEKKAVIELEYELIDKAPFREFLYDYEYFREWLPIIKKEFTITIPANQTLFYSISNSTIKPIISEKDGKKTYSWLVENVPLINHERNQKYKKEYLPTLFYTTCSSWNDLNKILYDNVEKSLTSSESIKAKVKTITEDSLTTWDKIIKIHEFVIDAINSIDYEFPDQFSFRNASVVFNSSYGASLDKATLLITMLKEIGIEAYPYLVPTTYSLNIKDNPNSSLIDKTVCCIKIDNENIFLDPENNLSDSGYDAYIGKTLIGIKKEGPDFKEFKKYTANENSIEINAQIDFDKDLKGKGKISIKLKNNCSPYYKLLGKSEDYKEITANYINKILPKATLKSCILRKLTPDDFEVIGELEEFSLEKGDDGFFKFSIPNTPESLTNSNYYLYRSSRMTPIFLPFPSKEITNIEIKLPENSSVILKPSNINLDVNSASVNIQCTNEEKKVTYSREMIFQKEIITPENYEKFKEVIITSDKNKYNTFIFK
ncbi:DUF3857 domain-containing protein [bacterium]|nr:DUF3857 domain-containing protein [bacterium]